MQVESRRCSECNIEIREDQMSSMCQDCATITRRWNKVIRQKNKEVIG